MNPDPELQRVLEKMADLPTFFGISLDNPSKAGHCGDTPLHVPAIRGDVAAGRVLIRNGADIDAIGELGYTPLHAAVGQGNHEFVELLLRRGADRNIENDSGRTPEEYAELMENHEMVQCFRTEH